jgi:NAD(P)-dependent dehydrogenase (short-subunit alcohol dehydrogenase family)
VSGASSGIGEAAVRMLARNGYVAFAGVRNETDYQRLSAEHANIRPLRFDVTDAESIARAVREAAASGARLTGVVSNAGVALGGPLERFPIVELRRQFDVNLFGALALVQAALPYLEPQKGRIVFVGSIAGRVAMPYNGSYSASKFALRAVADALRIELAPAQIGVSLVEAGSAKTAIWRKGRESRSQMAAMLGEDARAHYYGALDGLLRQTEAEERSGMPAERVARAIVHAFTARRPRATYLVGAARGGAILAALPTRVRDRILRTVQRL